MSVSSTAVSIEYPGDGTTVALPVPFRFIDASDLVVVVVDANGVEWPKTLSAHYTVKKTTTGGTVTMVAPAAGGEKTRITRATPRTQPGSLRVGGAFEPGVVEDMADRAVLQLQELDAAKLDTPATMTPLAPLVINAAGTGVEPGSTELTGDMLLRPNLAEAEAGKGADLVAFRDTLGTVYLKTVSDMLNGLPVSFMRFLPVAQHAGIRARTSTYDCAADLNAAFAAYSNFAMPAGRYMIGATLLAPDRLTIRGDGWSMPFASSAVQAPQGSVFKLIAGANCDMLRQAAKASRYSLTLEGFALDGDGANQTSVPTADGTYGIYQFNRAAMFFEALYNAVFRNVAWYNIRGAGLSIYGDATAGCTNIFIDNCHGYNARTYNVYLDGATTDVRIAGGDYGFGRVANARLSSSCTVNGAVFWTSQCQDITDANTHASGTGAVVGAGLVIAGNNNKVIGCRSEGNAGHGIKVAGSDNRVSDCAIYFNASSASTSGNFDGVNVAGARNVLENLDIRQSISQTMALRNAIKLEAGHTDARIRGGTIQRVGANAAAVALPVAGFSHASGDRSDFSWASGEVKAYSAIANSIGTSATKVQFRTETVDTRGEWDATTDTFTAAEAGIYRIDTSVNIANSTDGNSFIVAVYKNGSEYRRLGQQRAGAGSSVQISGGLEMKLEAGDTLDVRAICGTASNTNVGAALTWIEITQING